MAYIGQMTKIKHSVRYNIDNSEYEHFFMPKLVLRLEFEHQYVPMKRLHRMYLFMLQLPKEMDLLLDLQPEHTVTIGDERNSFTMWSIICIVTYCRNSYTQKYVFLSKYIHRII